MNSNAQKFVSVDYEAMKFFFVDFSLCSMSDLILHMHFLKAHLSTVSFEEKITLIDEKSITNYSKETEPLELLSSRNMFLMT